MIENGSEKENDESAAKKPKIITVNRCVKSVVQRKLKI